MIKVKRAYALPEVGDGLRYLVDRVWPRGVKRADLAVEDWVRTAAPSDDLRQWFGHDPARWEEFKQRYFSELELKPEAWQPLLAVARQGTVTLVFSARDEGHNQAVALKEFLDKNNKT
jgi:uncharacterized protein YeaO (DUF488 family)